MAYKHKIFEVMRSRTRAQHFCPSWPSVCESCGKETFSIHWLKDVNGHRYFNVCLNCAKKAGLKRKGDTGSVKIIVKYRRR